ncbi:ATP-binding protein [Bizionia myxarmorum]|nr:ATP-binding protein [Bizionia myxarmorum]
MQKAAEMVSRSLHVYNGISNLTAHYTQADSEELRDELLKPDKSSFAFDNYREEGRVIMDSLNGLVRDNPPQTKRLQDMQLLLNDLYKQLQDLDETDYEIDSTISQYREAQKSIISITLFQIRTIKNEMLVEEQKLMLKRQNSYDSSKSLAPIILLFLALFALLVFVLSFFRIYKNKLQIRQSENFLKSVLATTDNVVNYYTPIFDEEGAIIDFRIEFANACNRDYFGVEPDFMIGKTVLFIFPYLKDSVDFEKMKSSYLNNDKVKFESEFTANDSKMWFQSFITPLSGGILVTARNITHEEEAKSMQLRLRKRLESQNLQLLDGRALLANIFKSISHIVMHFKSVRNEEGKIIDFKILFVNDRITPITGHNPEEIKNKNVSEVYPDIFTSEVIGNLVDAIENKKPVTYNFPFNRNGNSHWFSATAIKLGDGVTITVRETTAEIDKANELLKLNEQLVIRNSILTDAESIAKIGSFSWYIESNTTEISDNFYRMLGHEPGEFESNLESFRNFVHPDDLELYDKKGEISIQGLVSDEFMYRVITKNGEIKFLNTNGQFIDKNGSKVMIGVVQDVTQTISDAEELRRSNLDLQQSNLELESFNRVASHDLQEPLRKIQLFISRIEDVDGAAFSEKGTTYFDKVKKAALRMQGLIQNLLAYSRIDSSKTDLDHIDLNDVLDKVQEDLATTINDTQAEITSENLPQIKGVFFQMEQLFANLIGNALKYKSNTEAPIIQLQSEKVAASELPDKSLGKSKFYYKITCTDNGIGFDSKYSDKIFEVFQRLHQKTEYSGTGIGLAICRKIVENHNGYIYATGKLGAGAQFVIFLPTK